MANKINLNFFNAYLELDEICAKRFEVSKGGLTVYINRLIELRFVPERSEVLPRLIKYRKLRNIISCSNVKYRKGTLELGDLA